MSTTPIFPGKVVLKLGIFPEIPQPEKEIFVASRQKWGQPYQGLAQYKTTSSGEKLE